MLRIDLQQSLSKSAVNPQRLSPFQRILLTTDGTLTEILEAHLWEPIEIVKLMQETIETPQQLPYLDIEARTKVLQREVLLRGRRSRKNYVHAGSVVVLGRLDPFLRQGLLITQEPLGKLLIQARLETFREIVTCGLHAAENLGDFFAVPPDATLISRTYRIFSNGKPFILITEQFPETYFLE